MNLKSLLITSAIVGLLSSVSSCSAQKSSGLLKQRCVIQQAEINENSGIAQGTLENTLWTHNDSGAQPVVYLVSSLSGKTIAQVNLPINNRDWEDIDTFKQNDQRMILVADVGDNLKKRESYCLYVFAEPKLTVDDHNEVESQTIEAVDVKSISFKYEDGAHDCEAVSVDESGGRVFLVEKIYTRDKGTPGIYVLELPKESPKNPLIAKRVGEVPYKNVTGMDFSGDGSQLILRTYVQGFLFQLQPQMDWTQSINPENAVQLALPLQRQGEGVCFSQDGESILLSSEFQKAPLWQLDMKKDRE